MPLPIRTEVIFAPGQFLTPWKRIKPYVIWGLKIARERRITSSEAVHFLYKIQVFTSSSVYYHQPARFLFFYLYFYRQIWQHQKLKREQWPQRQKGGRRLWCCLLRVITNFCSWWPVKAYLIFMDVLLSFTAEAAAACTYHFWTSK